MALSPAASDDLSVMRDLIEHVVSQFDREDQHDEGEDHVVQGVHHKLRLMLKGVCLGGRVLLPPRIAHVEERSFRQVNQLPTVPARRLEFNEGLPDDRLVFPFPAGSVVHVASEDQRARASRQSQLNRAGVFPVGREVAGQLVGGICALARPCVVRGAG